LCGGQVACFPWGDYADGGTHGWFVVSRGYSTTLLAIVLSAGYALVVRELRQINANLEQLIELGAVARRHDDRCADHHTKILDGIHKIPIADFQYQGNRRHGQCGAVSISPRQCYRHGLRSARRSRFLRSPIDSRTLITDANTPRIASAAVVIIAANDHWRQVRLAHIFRR